MGRHEIRNKILLFPQLTVSFFKPLLKDQKFFFTRLTHHGSNPLRNVFWRDFKLTRYMVLAEFLDECFIIISQHIIVAKARSNKDLFNPLKRPNFTEEIDVVIMIGIEIVTRLWSRTGTTATGTINSLLITGKMAEVGCWSSHIVDVAFEVIQRNHSFSLINQRLVRTILDNPPLMIRNSAEGTRAKTTPV